MRPLIRNGTVVTAEATFPADILVEGEKIKEVRQGIPENSGGRVIDATGLLLLPAGGEEIVIAKAGRPLARLVPLARRTAPRHLGLLEGAGWVGAEFDDLLPGALAGAVRGETC